MIIGVTGTRSGLAIKQLDEFLQFIKQCDPGQTIICHGDCVGADEEIAKISRSFGFKIVCFPPEKDDLRAWVESDEYFAPMSYFKRNRAIVDACDLLLVFPYQDSWQNNGGTWYTHDYAVKKNKPIKIFYPGRENKVI